MTRVADQPLRQPPGAGARPDRLDRLAVMVITRDRPDELLRSLASLAGVSRPADVDIVWIVVDNAVPPQEASIRALARAVGLPITYAWEAERGYASPRNRAVDLALANACDTLLFIDDDVTAEPDLLTAHLAALAAGDVDVSMGGQTGRAIGPTRRFRRMKVATFNVAFRSRLVTGSPGWGLRFDPRLNLTGFEDHEFFYEAQARGARIVRNGAARVRLADSAASITQKSMPDHLAATYFYATGRNLSYLRRIRQGHRAAWATALYLVTTLAARTAVNAPLSRIAAPFSETVATKARRHAVQDAAFMRGLWHGLSQPGVERAAAKRGLIVPIDGRPQASPRLSTGDRPRR